MDSRGAQIQRDVGLLVKKRRMTIGMSQETLAATIGLSRSSVANIECGRQKIGVPLLYMMAEILQTTPHELLPPLEGKQVGKENEVPLPKHLPEEEKDWIRTVLNPAKKSSAQSRP